MTDVPDAGAGDHAEHAYGAQDPYGEDGHGQDPYGADYYVGNGQDGDRPALRLYQRIARRRLGSGPLLDFGCGTGHLLRRLAAGGPADGLEAYGHGADRAARLVPSARVYRDLEDVPSGHYAGVVAVHVVEHIGDDELVAVLQQWRRVLRPGGGALVVTPDLHGLAHRAKGDRWLALTDPTHVNLKGWTDWASLFDEAGLRVVRSAADGLWDFPYPPARSRLLDVGLRGWPTLYQYARGDLLLPPGSGESVLMLLRAP